MIGTNAALLTIVVLGLWAFHCVRHRGKMLCLLSSLGTGALVGNTLFHLVPESFGEGVSVQEASTGVFLGYAAMLLVHRMLPCSHDGEQHKHKNIGYLNLISRCLDNATDGTVIAAGFLINTAAGLTMVLAICLHEVPLEFASFGIMRASGFTKRGALLANLLAAGCAGCAAAVVFGLGNSSFYQTGLLRPVTTGLALYTSCSVLVPREQSEKDARICQARLALVLAGVLVVSTFGAHEHNEHAEGGSEPNHHHLAHNH